MDRFDTGKPDRETELAKPEPVLGRTIDLGAAQSDQRGIEQRVEELDIEEPAVLRDHLRDATRVDEQAADAKRIRRRESRRIDHRGV